MKNLFTFFSLIIIGFVAKAQTCGCTDVLAKNYNADATINDGSCRYKKAKIKPLFSADLSDTLHESSGLLYWKHKLWSFNDDRDTNLYHVDTLGRNLQSLALPKIKNRDWEAIAHDSLHIYIGDIGNNVSGNRRDLHILKIEKKSLSENKIVVDTIFFSYENQVNFEAKKANKTDFDCETILATKDSLYLLTKEWKSQYTRLYALPNFAGTHQAKYKGRLNVKGLVTGGVIIENKKVIVLSGYSKRLQPFLYLLYDFRNNDFFSGNKRKVKLALPFHQIEGIATNDGLHFYLTNEAFTRRPFISVKQKLHKVDLTDFLK